MPLNFDIMSFSPDNPSGTAANNAESSTRMTLLLAVNMHTNPHIVIRGQLYSLMSYWLNIIVISWFKRLFLIHYSAGVEVLSRHLLKNLCKIQIITHITNFQLWNLFSTSLYQYVFTFSFRSFFNSHTYSQHWTVFCFKVAT